MSELKVPDDTEAVLSDKDEEWIKSNIRQRILAEDICTEKRGRDNDTEGLCSRCSRPWKEHAKSDEDVHTGTTSCNIYGNLKFVNLGETDCKYIHMDVDTDMSLVKHLLLNIWKIPKPSWMTAIMGEEDGDVSKGVPFQKKLAKFIENSFSDNEAVWISSEGLSVGLAGMTGKTISLSQKRLVHLGVNDMDSYSDIKLGNAIPDYGPRDKFNMPSKHCKFHIFTDGGKYSDTAPHVDQFFKINLEKMISQCEEETLSIPYVVILYGGWRHVIDGVKRALDENIPIIVIKGSGGFADFLVSIYEDTSTKKVVYTEGITKWTGTVLTEHHVKHLNTIVKLKNTTYHEGKRLMLDCLKKRELITVYSCENDKPDHESSLLYAVFEALLKTKTFIEKCRLVDFYMSEDMHWVPWSAPSPNKRKVMKLLFWQLLTNDEAQTIQFILEQRGFNIVEFLVEMKKGQIPRITKDEMVNVKLGSDDDAYKFLFNWAVKNNKVGCVAYFWKKGENLLTSALKRSSEYLDKENHKKYLANGQSQDHDEKDIYHQYLDKDQLQEYGSLFKGRAVGLIEQCYREESEMAMKLMKSQWVKLPQNEDHLSLAMEENNIQIFETKAYRDFIQQIWNGQSKKMPSEESNTARTGVLTHCYHLPPRIKYWITFVHYALFLGVFGYALLVKLQPRLTAWEITLAVWWFAFLMEEIRQFCIEDVEKDTFFNMLWAKSKKHFGNHWNALDAACLLLFLLGLILLIPVYTDQGQVDFYTSAKFVFAFAWMLFTFRSLQFLAMSNFFAPLLEMIYRMLLNLLPFLGILLVFILAFGLAVRSLLYANCELSLAIIFDLFKDVFWASFGEFDFGGVHAGVHTACASDPEYQFSNKTSIDMGEYGAPILLSIFVVLTNLLLMNVIIAKFSDTYQDVEREAKWLAPWHQARFTLEYMEKPLLAPPLNILLLFKYAFMLLMWLRQKGDDERAESEQDIPLMNITTFEEPNILDEWERCMAKVYLLSSESESELQNARSAEARAMRFEKQMKKQMSRAVEEITKRLDIMESKQSQPNKY